MNRDTIQFEGKEYPCRIMEDYEGTECIIAGDSLQKALFVNNPDTDYPDYKNKEAELVDDKVFFYVGDDELDFPDSRLEWILRREFPDWF